jgi:hypothetical protein
LISAFVIFHLTGTLVWIMPFSPLKQSAMPLFMNYMIPTGLWQGWSMFSPDPQRETVTLETEVIDKLGMRHVFEFPKVADLPWWRKLPRFRHSKFASNLFSTEFVLQREFTARHAVRQLGLPASAFPVHATLYYQVQDPPPSGSTESDPLAPRRALAIGTYDFATFAEVHP